ncbi:UBX domain-containing protein 1 isoform X2 [Folsomia candida]|uniref:UBX domain-containing protein 1 isoform X2 n=1 Tax=Folsomia candida TaxID=158441 RepID=UPI000B8FC8C8|nr:UBX domain-containing protein 1 isoform X2 [Folsomia candida]
MADFVSLLVDMGFDPEKSKMAVEKTGNQGVEPAMEWILSHPDEPSPSAEGGGSNDNTSTTTPATDTKTEEVPKSWKCEDCGKLFASMDTVEFHAAKTNHSNFSESTEEKKPLTAEEKAEQQKKLVELMKTKRVEREAKEKLEEIEREKQRMASGKDLIEAKRRLEEQEMKEMIAQKQREKREDKAARDRVKAQIEEDRLARKAKFGGGGSGTSITESPPVSVKPSPMEVDVVKKDYTHTKLQLRLPSGKTMTQTFGVSEPLAAVRVYIEMNRDDGVEGSFNLITNFPRKTFVEDDYDKPLLTLGLVPSAVLMVTRS